MGLIGVELSGELWQEILTVGWKVGDGRVVECIEGLPKGAVFKSVFYRQWPGMSDQAPTPSLIFVFEHPDFEEVAKGEAIPTMVTVHRQTYPDE